MSGLKNLFFGLWTYMVIQYVGVRGTEKMKEYDKKYIKFMVRFDKYIAPKIRRLKL